MPKKKQSMGKRMAGMTYHGHESNTFLERESRSSFAQTVGKADRAVRRAKRTLKDWIK